MTPDNRREELIRSAFEGVGDEMLAVGPSKSGSVTVHFQHGVPLKVEWRMLARALDPVPRP